MKHWGIARRALSLGVLIASVAGGSAQAAPSSHARPFSTTSACSAPSYSLSQPYGFWGDFNWYTLAPGQSVDSFDGTGWVLSGGATLVTTALADGSTGTVLDLPAGSQAVSPPMCVASDYPTARTTVRDVVGAPSVRLSVDYTGKPTPHASASGTILGRSAWGNSQILQLHPGNLPGWQLVTYTLAGGSYGADAQVYDFYVDPRSRY